MKHELADTDNNKNKSSGSPAGYESCNIKTYVDVIVCFGSIKKKKKEKKKKDWVLFMHFFDVVKWSFKTLQLHVTSVVHARGGQFIIKKKM